MTKSKSLQIEIGNAIEKIKILSKNDNVEVHNILLSVLEKYLNLPKEEFINDFFY